MTALPVIFFIIAMLYASVGFGGGSSYSALLVLSGLPFVLVPFVSLLCNLSVSSGNTIYFLRTKLLRGQCLPLLLASLPAAFLGGLTPIREQTFTAVLGTALLVAGLKLGMDAFEKSMPPSCDSGTPRVTKKILLVSAAIGYLSGLVGIGGGIFLSPALHFARWGSSRQIAAVSSAYITMNSAAALLGKALNRETLLTQLYEHSQVWLLIPAVLLGGMVGRRAAAHWLPPQLVKGLTATLIVFVALRLLLQLL